MHSYSANIVAKYRLEPAAAPDNMLNALLYSKDPKMGETLNELRVIDKIIILFIGSTTMPCFISFVLFYLLQNPNIITTKRLTPFLD